jgi:putative heme-binding domain-containing protein
VSSIFVAEPTAVEFLGTSNGPLEVWLNGKPVFKREKGQEFRIDSDRSTVTIPAGENRLSVRLDAIVEAPGEFQLRFRRKSATQAHEQLIASALSRGGNVEQGKQVFLNTEKTLCLKCHRVQDQGERTGPELTGLGSRFSRIYIAESILDPSRTIAPSFGTLVIRLESGQVLSGVKIAETENSLTLVDNLAQKHIVVKADIEEQKTSPLSTMPEGLEKKLTESEFVDLVAYLATLKESKP